MSVGSGRPSDRIVSLFTFSLRMILQVSGRLFSEFFNIFALPSDTRIQCQLGMTEEAIPMAGGKFN